MDASDKTPIDPEQSADRQRTPDSPGPTLRERLRRSGPWGAVVIVAAIVAVVVLLAVGVDAIASSPAVCASCHEMKPWVASWRVSPHARVRCDSCHGTPRPWYGAPLSALERWRSLLRDVQAHGTSPNAEVTTGTVPASAKVPDSTCLTCHTPKRVGTSRFGVTIKHAEHAARNKSCVSCHRWTAHPDRPGLTDTLAMEQCFTCHSLTPGAKASGECGVCHAKGTELRPASHLAPGWLKKHGPFAKVDRAPCALCHRDDSCLKCHGLPMPHGAAWATRPSVHAAVANKDPSLCRRCHAAGSELCAKCHKKGYDHHRVFDPVNGPWISAHSARGTAPICFRCHEDAFCASCHGVERSREATPAR